MKRLALTAIALVLAFAGPAAACKGKDHTACAGKEHADCKMKGHAGDTASATKFGKMTVTQVAEKLQNKAAIHIYDNNSRERFEKGHIPGAVWLSHDDVKASDFPADKNAEMLFYCANERCSACQKAAKMALELGYTNVHIMPEGIMGWEKAEKPVETGAADSVRG